MNIYRLETMPDAETVGAIGYFDGVHLGHRAVLGRAVEAAREAGRMSIVITFDLTAFRPDGKGGSDLITRDACFSEFEKIGLDGVCILPMDAVCGYSPEDFCRIILFEKLHVRSIFCGDDFRFGKDRAGDVKSLQKCGDEMGFTVCAVGSVAVDGKEISTSRIKAGIQNGEIEAVNRMLGRNYGFDGVVYEDKKLGRKLGFPTANTKFEYSVKPKAGVYISEVSFDGRVYPGVTNLGIRPTVGSTEYISETHILGFDGELVGKTIHVELLKFRRSEQKFGSIDELKSTISKDAEAASRYFEC